MCENVWVANSQYEGIRLCGGVLQALAVMVRFAPCANSSSSLFALLLSDPASTAAVRQWLATPFLTDLLPPLLMRVECRVGQILRKGGR